MPPEVSCAICSHLLSDVEWNLGRRALLDRPAADRVGHWYYSIVARNVKVAEGVLNPQVPQRSADWVWQAARAPSPHVAEVADARSLASCHATSVSIGAFCRSWRRVPIDRRSDRGSGGARRHGSEEPELQAVLFHGRRESHDVVQARQRWLIAGKLTEMDGFDEAPPVLGHCLLP